MDDDMHVIDDETMQDLIRFVKAHHTFVRHNLVIRQRAIEFGCLVQELKDLAENYRELLPKAEPIAKRKA